jgi:hypothetical protein
MDIVEILNDCIVGRHMHAESQDLALSCGFCSRMHAASGRRPQAERHTDCLHKNTRVAQAQHTQQRKYGFAVFACQSHLNQV